MRARQRVVWAVWSSLIVGLANGDERVDVHGESAVVFASVEAGRAALATPDRFTLALSQFDLECRLGTSEPVTTEKLLAFAADQVRAWTAEEKEKLLAIIANVRQRLAGLKLPLPKTILLIKTTGRDEGDAAYTRGPAVVLPQRYVDQPPARLERVFIHELFHVLSSHNEELRNALYAVIGFKPCLEVKLPPSLAERKITNPDGPTLSNYIEVEADGRTVRAVPLLFSPRQYNQQQGGSLFDYLQFRLLVVQPDGEHWRAAEADGSPWLLDPAATPSFGRQIGENTRYIIHPDEILAENFVHLAMQTPDLPSPQIVEQIRLLLNNRDAVPPEPSRQ